MLNLTGHFAKCAEIEWKGEDAPPKEEVQRLRERIEPWLASLMQSDHISLLVGNGLTTATAVALKATSTPMTRPRFQSAFGERVGQFATESAIDCRRGEPNLEDDLRAAQALIQGLRVLSTAPPLPAKPEGDVSEELPPQPEVDRSSASAYRATLDLWTTEYEAVLTALVADVLTTERGIAKTWDAAAGRDVSGLHQFLLSFASRPPSRDRLDIFTTNYDRLIEDASDRLGLRIIDRFVGTLTPRFRASRLSVDMHFDPPGIRGEPRYLEGVVRLTKLHGSLDWRWRNHEVVRDPIPFAPAADPVSTDVSETLMIYPNAAKDMETLAYPYAELFRDFAAAVCRPNVSLFIYGYSFGDDHVNRILREMLTISSTHLVIISFDGCKGRLQKFCDSVGHGDQLTILVGAHFGSLGTFVANYLPRTLIEPVRRRQNSLREGRGTVQENSPKNQDGADGETSDQAAPADRAEGKS